MTKKTETFINASPPAADAEFYNIHKDEMNNVIAIDGSSVDATGLVNNQEAQSIKAYVSQAGILCTDSGSSANSYILTASSPFTNPPLKTGTRVRFKTANANTGSSTITPFGGSAITCKKTNGSTDLTTGDIPANTEVEFVYNGTNFVQVLGRVPATITTQGVAFLSNPITISNNATDANNDIDFSAGNAPLDDGSGQVLLPSTFVKRLDASWVAGTNQGGLFSGTKANSTKYYLFVITNGTINDAGFDTSPTGANIPSGYKGSYRGMVLTDSSGNIRRFIKSGQHFFYLPEITDHTPTPTTDVFNTYKLSCPEKSGILAIITVKMRYSGSGVVTQAVNSRQTGTLLVNSFGGGAVQGWSDITFTQTLPINSSAEIDIAFYFAAPSDLLEIRTKGYIDTNIK